MTLSATPLEKILQAVNEKYGTSFEGWSQLPTAYEVGGTVPNWNAYEKIYGEFGIKIASLFGGSTIMFFGYLYNNIYHYYAVDEDTAYGANETDGKIVTQVNLNDTIQQLLLEHMNSADYNVSSIQPDVIQLEMGTIVPNWDDYIKI